uniref:Uncharacterized protein n=1 Tax=Rousettus aegyptiacus TaxID=9407 RepID=A0A7J8DIU2_ROUAE|nr:hypothetical protein HJG63_008629 [Rousettus aegyptiacus]
MNIKPQDAQKFPRTRNPKRPTPRHLIIKMPKVKYKERILKAARDKKIVTYKRAPIRLAADFSKEIVQDRRAWHKIFNMMKTQDLQPRILSLAKLSFRVEGHIKSFPDKNRLKEFIATKPILQEMLEGLL